MYTYMLLMRDEKEERKKQARSNKQTNKAKQHSTCTCMTVNTSHYHIILYCKWNFKDLVVSQRISISADIEVKFGNLHVTIALFTGYE